MRQIDKAEADAIWNILKEGFTETAALSEAGNYLGLSKEEDLSAVSRILGNHSWHDHNLPYGDSRSHRIDYEGFQRMIQYKNEKKELFDDFYFDCWKEQEKKKAELLTKFHKDIIDRSNNKPRGE